ncbi:MAG TPA: type II toxin-antitoxin system PrlF family antitoxin [Longimicrobium sp.]|jgi:antitoxin PrlF
MSCSEEAGALENDPVLQAYLAFLEREMVAHPELIRPLDPDVVASARELVEGIPVDLDEELGEGAFLP